MFDINKVNIEDFETLLKVFTSVLRVMIMNLIGYKMECHL